MLVITTAIERIENRLSLVQRELMAMADDNGLILMKMKGSIGSYTKTLELINEIAGTIKELKEKMKGEQENEN